MMFPIVLGAVPELGQIIPICIFVISILSWFVSVIKGNVPERTLRPQQPRPKPQPIRTEIESLLKQVSEDKQKQAAQRKEKHEQQQQKKASKERGHPAPNATVQRPGGPPPYRPSRQTPRAAEVPAIPSNLGSGVRSQQLTNRVEADVPQDVTAAVQHDLGNRIAAAVPAQERPVHPLVKVLRDPKGVRQAFLLNEILQPPKSLRR